MNRPRLGAFVGPHALPPTFAGVALALSLVWIPTVRAAGHEGHASGPMTDAAMKRWADAWWATHPRVGKESLQPAAATFTVTNFRFDADNNALTQVDTVTILEGETVLWQWVAGIHSITNGTGIADPEAGTLFDQPSSVGSPQFSFQFGTPGTFPFFCRPHEINNMTGVVKVLSPVGVERPIEPLGFTDGPVPTPTRSGVTFGFGLRVPGRALAEVFDAGGRRIARVLDRDLDAGRHAGAWDGRTAGGAPAGAGLYYLRLRLPGYESSRLIVIAR
ncbi:MAG: cupredoxin domain-containing protein [Candidatus Eiseniibacteriota bacterium]